MIQGKTAVKKTMGARHIKKIFILLAMLAPALRAATQSPKDGKVRHAPGIVDNIPAQDSIRALYLTFNLTTGGKFDKNLVTWLSDNDVPATFFVSTHWILPESGGFSRQADWRQIYKNPIFMVENHGRENLPATNGACGLSDEILVGQTIIRNAAGYDPRESIWYRSGGAVYDTTAVRYITDSMNLRIAGFAIDADNGGTSGKDEIYNRMMNAKSGDIIMGNGTRPGSDAHQGYSRAIAELKRRGYKFRKLPER